MRNEKITADTSTSADSSLYEEAMRADETASAGKTQYMDREAEQHIFFCDGEVYQFASENLPECMIDSAIREVSSEGITISLKNNTDSVFEYGAHYSIYVKNTSGEYERLYSTKEGEYCFLDVMYVIQPGSADARFYSFSYYNTEDFKEGEYLFCCENVNFQADDDVVEYELYNEVRRKNHFNLLLPFSVKIEAN